MPGTEPSQLAGRPQGMEESLAVLEVHPVATRTMLAMSNAKRALCGDFMMKQFTVSRRECKVESEDLRCGGRVPANLRSDVGTIVPDFFCRLRDTAVGRKMLEDFENELSLFNCPDLCGEGFGGEGGSGSGLERGGNF